MSVKAGHASYIFLSCIFIGAAIIVSALSFPYPTGLFANITASMVDKLAFQPASAAQPTLVAQPGFHAQATNPTAEQAPIPSDVTALKTRADQSQAESQEPQSEFLLRQFQAWAAAQANDAPTQKLQDTPAKLVQNPLRLSSEDTKVRQKHGQKRWHARLIHNARSKRLAKGPRRPLRLVQDARGQIPPEQAIRAQDSDPATQLIRAPFR
jgi:hypothetical protein